MKKIFILSLLCILLFQLTAQHQTSHLKPLRIGDKVPEVLVGSFTNYPHKYAKFSAFRGKLVILDFWGTYCSGCIEKFPELDSMQKRFGEKIQVILVNTQPLEKINAFQAHQIKYGSPFQIPDLPLVTGDKILEDLFPHTSIPHEVWIDASGHVSAITESKYVTRDNIEKKLANSSYRLPEKKDFLSHEPYNALLPQLYPVEPGIMKYYSTIMKYKEGLVGPTYRYVIDSANRSVRMTRVSLPILALYADALSDMEGFNYPYEGNYFDFGKRLELNVKDSSWLIRPPDVPEEWKQQHYYSYEAILPVELKDSLYAYMLKDLDKFFGLHGSVEKRMRKCLAIVRTSEKEKFRSDRKGPRPVTDTSIHYTLYNTPMPVFRQRLSMFYKDTSFIFSDDTGYTYPIDIELAGPVNDLASLKKELRQKYDLDIVEKFEPVDVMVITETRK